MNDSLQGLETLSILDTCGLVAVERPPEQRLPLLRAMRPNQQPNPQSIYEVVVF